MAVHRATYPFVGVDRKKDSQDLSPGEARSAINIHLDEGRIKRRDGVTEKVTWPISGPVTGIFDYKQNDGTILQVAIQDQRVRVLTSWSSVTLGTDTFSSSNPASAAVVGNRLYICDGDDFKVTDGTTLQTPNIARPVSAPTTSANTGSTNLTGEYDYRYTYYSSTWGQESPSSAASTSVEVTDDGINVTVTQSGDSRVDFIRIYRRRIDAGETVWRLSRTVANTSGTYVDTTRDNEVAILASAPLAYSSTLPTMDFMTYQSGVLFMVSRDFPTRIYYTDAYKPWVVTSFFELSGVGGETDTIEGLASYQGVVIVFKRNSIWVLSGNNADTFDARKTASHVGCVSHHSIVEAQGLLYFMSEDGFYVFNGSVSEEISREIQSSDAQYALDRNFSRDRYAVGVHDHERNVILWSFSSDGSSDNDNQLAYFYRNSQIVGAHSWCPWSFGNGSVPFAAVVTDATTERRELVFGFQDGGISQYDESVTTDDGTAITWHWRSGQIDGGEATQQKRFGEVAVEFNEYTSDYPVQVSYYRDGDAEERVLGVHDGQKKVFRSRLRRRANTIELSMSGADPVDASEFVCEYELVGRSRI